MQTALDINNLPATKEILQPLRFLPKRYNGDMLDILLVEDALSDALLTRLALDECNVPYRLCTLRKGSHVLPFLATCGVELPDLIMLDLGLPEMDGFEILAGIAENPAALRAIPIVILTNHPNFEYIKQNYPLCIMDYINKPCRAEDMRGLLSRVSQWRSA